MEDFSTDQQFEEFYFMRNEKRSNLENKYASLHALQSPPPPNFPTQLHELPQYQIQTLIPDFFPPQLPHPSVPSFPPTVFSTLPLWRKELRQSHIQDFFFPSRAPPLTCTRPSLENPVREREKTITERTPHYLIPAGDKQMHTEKMSHPLTIATL